MATFWERGTGFGDGANDLLDLDTLQTVFLLRFADLITASRAKTMLGLTSEQGDEFDPVLARVPGHLFDIAPFAAKFRAVFHAARTGIPELDTVENVMLALGFDPPPPPEEP